MLSGFAQNDWPQTDFMIKMMERQKLEKSEAGKITVF